MGRVGNSKGQIMRGFAFSQNGREQAKQAHMLREDREGNGKDIEERGIK